MRRGFGRVDCWFHDDRETEKPREKNLIFLITTAVVIKIRTFEHSLNNQFLSPAEILGRLHDFTSIRLNK
jgi:hypothetical protein